ncbi:MAG: hypothetical protein ACLQBD_07600 [Syntrophobacteraceae bacterium]
MCRAMVAAFPRGALMRQLDRLTRHLALGVQTTLSSLFHDVAVAIAGSKIHLAVDVAGVLTQGLLDNAHRLDELAPVHRAQEPEAADAVAHRDLVRSLLLVLRAHQLLDGQAGLGQLLFNPGEGQCQSGALPLQAAREFRNKRADHRGVRPCHVGDRQNKVLRVLCGDLRHLVGPIVGAVSIHPVSGDPDGNPPKILDQGQAQHDRDGPQFAQLQDRHRLVGGYETAEALRVHPSIPVRDRFQREVIHSRKPGRWAVKQARQLSAVSLWQVSLSCAYLFFN